MWDGFHDMNGWGWLMMSFAILFWIGAIAMLVWLLTGSGPPGRHRPDTDSDQARADPREIIDLRLANGEITIEEHARLVQALHPGRQ
ncbi:MAG: hypothetical protein IT431_07245 [Phycisphaerales bacterium]|nr:hypothetical protein [Phycisphaerales bacterium]